MYYGELVRYALQKMISSFEVAAGTICWWR